MDPWQNPFDVVVEKDYDNDDDDDDDDDEGVGDVATAAAVDECDSHADAAGSSSRQATATAAAAAAGALRQSHQLRQRRRLGQVQKKTVRSNSSTMSELLPPPPSMRRLSLRRLSTSINWKAFSAASSQPISAAAAATIADEAKILCARYVRARFRRSGIFAHRKLDGLRRLRSTFNLTTSPNCNDFCDGQSREIFESILLLGQTLESRHLKTYTSVCRQIYRILVSAEAAVDVFVSVAHGIIATNITWGRVIALFAVAGALAVDCVHQGHVDYVLAVINGFRDFVERELAPWIIEQGGWCALVTMVRPKTSEDGLPTIGLFVGGVAIVVIILYGFIKFLLIDDT